MKTLSQIFEEESSSYGKTIAIIPGSFKPPTPGHLDMAIKYSKIADEVIIVVSDPNSPNSLRKTKSGKIITGEEAKEIWEIYLKRYNLKNVKVVVSPIPSPVNGAFKYIEKNLHHVNIILGSSKKDDYAKEWQRITDYYRDKLTDINILDTAKYAVDPYTANGNAVNATDIRMKATDISTLKRMMPSKLSALDLEAILKILV